MGMDTNDGLARIARRKCIASLLQGLSKEGIIVYPNGYTDIANMPRGCAFFLRFIPKETTFELQTGFPKYFQSSRGHDLISRKDAELLVTRLAALGSHLRANYKGRFLEELHTGVIGELLDSAADAEALNLLQATEDWFPDLLHEQLRWPCVLNDYLMPSEFSPVTYDPSRIYKMAENPIRALIAGLGLVRTGHWLGLSTDDIHCALDLLDASSQGEPPPDMHIPSKEYAEKLVIPIFSLGFQGAIIGLFSRIEPHRKMRLRSILDQAGHCLGELYAMERRTKLMDFLRQSKATAKTLAEVALQIASPIEHVVVSSKGEHHGYAICKERNHLAGYNQKTGSEAQQLKQDRDNEILDLHSLDPPAQIFIKPLRGYEALDPVIHGLRIKTALSEFFCTAPGVLAISSPLKASSHISTLEVELDKVIIALQQQMGASHGRRAAAKYLCFFEFVKDKLGAKELRLTNAEMQRRMSLKLEISKLSGYQVTGEALRKFSAEINDLLPDRFIFENLSDKVVLVSW